MKKILAVAVIFLLGGPVYADEQSEAVAAGKQIFDTRCADLCHQTPSAGRLSAKQWRVVLNTMQVRMKTAGMPPLTDEEFEQVLEYLSKR